MSHYKKLVSIGEFQHIFVKFQQLGREKQTLYHYTCTINLDAWEQRELTTNQ